MKRNKIKKEKRELVKQLEQQGVKDAFQKAGEIINKKYGKGCQYNPNGKSGKTYNEWWQERNLDGSFAYNGVTDDF